MVDYFLQSIAVCTRKGPLQEHLLNRNVNADMLVQAMTELQTLNEVTQQF